MLQGLYLYDVRNPTFFFQALSALIIPSKALVTLDNLVAALQRSRAEDQLFLGCSSYYVYYVIYNHRTDASFV